MLRVSVCVHDCQSSRAPCPSLLESAVEKGAADDALRVPMRVCVLLRAGAPRPLRSSVSLPSGPTELVSAVEPVVTNMKVVGKLPAFKPGRRRSALVGGF